MLQAYSNDPALGCPFDGRNTTYGQTSQFKRMSAIFTDGTYIEAWTEYLRLFPHAWGIMFEQPIPGTDPAYGVQHAADLGYYFPSVSVGGSSSQADKMLQSTLQTAVVRFVANLDPGWPRWIDSQRVLAINANGTAEEVPPHRPGFDVIKKFLRPE
jgi:acetylcholinesterase